MIVKPLLRCCIAASTLSLTVSAEAGFSNFAPGNAYDGQTGFTVTGLSSMAMSFQANQSGQVEEILLGLLLQSGPFTTSATVALYDDASLAPGTVLGQWSAFGMGAPGPNPTALSINVANGPSLTAGETYWLAVSLPFTSQAELLWGLNTTDDVGLFANSAFGGPWDISGPDTRGAFAVVVPAPPAMAVVLLGLGVAGRRRRG